MDVTVSPTNLTPEPSRTRTRASCGITTAQAGCSHTSSSNLDTVRSTPDPNPPPRVPGKRTTLFIQDECLKHRFIRSRDTSNIVERPERLHAVKLGLAAAISRIEQVAAANVQKRELVSGAAGMDEGELADALARMEIAPTADEAHVTPTSPLRTDSVTIRRTTTSVSLLNHPAIKFIHGDIDGDVYLENLVAWARDSQKNIANKGTEIPEGIPPLDLYLCPGSIDAIQGAIGAVCEAVDASIAATRKLSQKLDDPSSCERAFVAIRPPGHHCGEDTPSGFCFINNIAVGAAHAHLNHGIQRIVILDIDLHHGNGTQSIAWQINEETYRQTLESESGAPAAKPGPRIFYGSLHDILSFPCEDGKPELVQAASTSIHGPHGQYIYNTHLQRYDSEDHFWDTLYPHYLLLVHRARDFLDETGGPGDDVIVFISCGFDAGEHEYPSMSRHHRKVPVGFYHRFTRETCKLADSYAHGRVVSVLEGGYSDRALMSGAMAHLCGLVDNVNHETLPDADADRWVDDTWWGESNLVKLEKAAKPRRSVPARASMEPWLTRTMGLLSVLNGGETEPSLKRSSSRGANASVGAAMWAPPPSMTLRERRKPAFDDARGVSALPTSVRTVKNRPGARSVSGSEKRPAECTSELQASASAPTLDLSGDLDLREAVLSSDMERKKLPRVILHVRSPDS